MSSIAWTLRYTGGADIEKVTTLHELEEIMRALKLPGVVPPEFVTNEVSAHHAGTYSFDPGGEQEWSLIWTKFETS